MRISGITPMLGIATAACGTIDQVPLAYVSTVKVGISAESATAQVPGGKVMIGVEATDAALVPVAIGRTCSGGVGKTCDEVNAPIRLVTGNNDISPATYLQLAQSRAEAIRSASDAIRRDETALADAVRNSVTAQESDDQAKAGGRLLDDLQQEADAEKARVAAAGIAAVDPAVDQRARTRDARIAQIRAEQNARGNTAATLANARRVEADARNRLDESYARFEASQTALRQALDQHPTASGKRQDALSVFGSFNANANAEVGQAGAGLKLGKSFSTGVAAQLLTEGLKQAASSNAAAGCLTAAAAIGAQQPKALADALRICEPARRDTGS